MTKISPTEAAKRWKIGKTTIYRAIERGDITPTQDGSGHKKIDITDMLRVFGEPKQAKDAPESDSSSAMVKTLREMIERQDKAHNEHLKSLQAQVDSYQEQVAKLLENQADTTKLLMHLQDSVDKKPAEATQPVEVVEPVAAETPSPKPEQKIAKRKKSLFGRLLAASIDD